MEHQEHKEIKLIGKGCQGTTWLCKRRTDGKLMAVKTYRDVVWNEKPKIPYEVYVLKERLPPHRGILRCIGWEHDPNNSVRIEFDFYKGGSLERLIRKRRGRSEKFIWNVFIQLAEAIDFLHQHNITHSDVKPANIFLREEYATGGELPSLVLGDFGHAFMGNWTKDGRGRPMWQGPEYPAVTVKTDVWGVGAIIHALAYARGPMVPMPEAEWARVEAQVKLLSKAERQEAFEEAVDEAVEAWEESEESKFPLRLVEPYSPALDRASQYCLRLDPEERIDSSALTPIVRRGKTRYETLQEREKERQKSQEEESKDKESEEDKSQHWGRHQQQDQGHQYRQHERRRPDDRQRDRSRRHRHESHDTRRQGRDR